MKQGSMYEGLFQVAALILVIIIVHGTYVTVIRPNADLIQEQQALMQEQNPELVPERSVFIILRNYEQEFCMGCHHYRHENPTHPSTEDFIR